MIRVNEDFQVFFSLCPFYKGDANNPTLNSCNHPAKIATMCLESKYCARIIQKIPRQKPTPIESPAAFSIPEHLKEVWPHFLEMRNRIKKPATARAQKNLIADLERMAPANWEAQKAMVEQSITHSWQAVYEIKGNYTNKNTPSFLR
jgi:hypothetical protein